MLFTYKNPNVYDKKYAILKELEVEKKVQKDNEKYIKYSLLKKEYNRITDVETIMKESKMRENPNNEEIIPYNVEKIRKKGVKVIYNVYQSKYSNGKVNGTGFGDFIRGSYFLLEFCEKYGFIPKIVFNNCISKFLQTKVKNIDKIQNILANIEMFHNNNFKEFNIKDNCILYPRLDLVHIMADFVDYVTKLYVYNEKAFIYCIPYPLNTISENSKAYMRMILEPTNEIKEDVNQNLKKNGLNYKEYSVFHIRSGDNYLKEENKKFYIDYLNKLKVEIKYILRNNQQTNAQPNQPKYLLIADNNEVKILLKKEFPEMKIILKEITHLGEGVMLEEEKVKHTLIDFYLLSFANNIISFSCNQHGSGFSYWCAVTFDIPYVSKYINSM